MRTSYSPRAGERTGKARPPCSRDTAASCSFIAEAIQITSRCEASPVSAVTRPPEPRWTSPPAWNVTGPRLLTSTSGVRCPGTSLLQQAVEDPEVVAQVARREEVLAHVLLPRAPERAPELG